MDSRKLWDQTVSRVHAEKQAMLDAQAKEKMDRVRFFAPIRMALEEVRSEIESVEGRRLVIGEGFAHVVNTLGTPGQVSVRTITASGGALEFEVAIEDRENASRCKSGKYGNAEAEAAVKFFFEAVIGWPAPESIGLTRRRC